ncbi:hypothetical protein M2451_003985 [Dysgonomonas sp. PFB1-18]|uniref:toxin VasX n=1 Tax=unclassified Dysgonomonas TaxID=2630389 RepID=UPI002473B4BC|nr:MULTISPECIES: toxin VasX [unclassified Dysgonomonas]MDH6311101.1 hypothetical protein [Dysgonomonas sp. PF1-14]MDH6340981.1 hypothetical protein [Dysgonomonas sp. PF1-16]MDH6382640.1 hypothetical protein [Dysgonomonas sp. PFB1-18]MDH6399987.1 hypothetical protein [Dysgonomonas sp. PF1-23]
MSEKSYSYDIVQQEESETSVAEPRDIPKKCVPVYLSRLGAVYKDVDEEDYKVMSFGSDKKVKPKLVELEKPTSLVQDAPDFKFFRKNIRDGYVYIYCQADSSWLVYQTEKSKYKLIEVKNPDKALKEMRKWLDKRTFDFIFLPEDKKYKVSFSTILWTDDFREKTVNDESYFSTIDTEKWKDAKEKSSPQSLPPVYAFREDMYELRDKSSGNKLTKNIYTENITTVYKPDGNPSRKDSDKQKVIYYTLNDTLGIAEDIHDELSRFLLYKEVLNTSIRKGCEQSKLDKGNKYGDKDDGNEKDYEALYLSAALLHNMLYAKDGALNQPEHQKVEECDNKHKYQSMVQEYKITQLLAVKTRENLQKKYSEMRDVFGSVISSEDYNNALIQFIDQTLNISLVGKHLINNHLKTLKAKPDSYDSDISRNEKSEPDKWAKLNDAMTFAYLQVEGIPIDERYRQMNMAKLLAKKAVPESVAKESKELPEGQVKLDDSKIVAVTVDILKDCVLSYTGALERINENLSSNIDGLKDSINMLISEEAKIVGTRENKIAELLEEYQLEDSPGLKKRLLAGEAVNVKGETPVATGATREKIKEAGEQAIKYKKRRSRQIKQDLSELRIKRLEVFRSSKAPKRLAASAFTNLVECVGKILPPINLMFAIDSVQKGIREEKQGGSLYDGAYYTLFLFGHSFQLVQDMNVYREVPDKINKWIGRSARVRQFLAARKVLTKVAGGVVVDVALFAADCVECMRLVETRNTSAANYQFISSALGLMSGVCFTLAVTLTVSWPVVVVLVLVAVGTAVLSYYMGERSDKRKHDIWQSFLICSVFTNYIGPDKFSRKINTNIDVSSSKRYYEVAQELYLRRKRIAKDDFTYKKDNYNLQDFAEMLRLLDEMSTAYEVHFTPKDIRSYAKDSTKNYLVPTILHIDISYFGVLRYDSVDYIAYVNAGNGLGRFNASDIIEEMSETTGQGQSTMRITIKPYEILKRIQAMVTKNDYEHRDKLINSRVIYKEDDAYRVYFSPDVCLVFASRLVNTKQEDAMYDNEKVNYNGYDGEPIPITVADKRTYMPYEGADGKNIYKGLKCRLAIPVPKDSGDFSAKYYQNLYGHMEYGTGTLGELEYLDIRDINYTTKAK